MALGAGRRVEPNVYLEVLYDFFPILLTMRICLESVVAIRHFTKSGTWKRPELFSTE